MSAITPITRREKILSAIAGNGNVDIEPITREEKFLAKIAGFDTSVPAAVTRKEMLYEEILEREVVLSENEYNEKAALGEIDSGKYYIII